MNGIALIIGGAECAMEDYKKASDFCFSFSITPKIFIINDMIASFPGEVIAVTLHPDKLPNWLIQRNNNKLPIPSERWSNRPGKQVTHTTKDWGGSSGLFAPKIAKEKGLKSILCGVPMTVDGMHFVRHQRWSACSAFRKPWLERKAEMLPFIRSMSGWTAQEYGQPNSEWIK